ncbi:patatin-like phospholipase family protein [Kaarinaea lacus]
MDNANNKNHNKSRQHNSNPVSSEDDAPYIPYNSTDMQYFGADKVIEKEQQYLLKRQKLTQASAKEQSEYLDNRLTALAFSGGGIRSASFCLGVMQALSYNRWLKKIDYLSTVSGGGYIGSSLTWLLSRKWEATDVGVDRENFPYGTYPIVGQETIGKAEDSAEVKMVSAKQRYRGALLRYLRQNGKYLTPGQGISVMSLIGVVLRGSLLSIFVYFSLLVLLFTLLGETFLFKSIIDFGIVPSSDVLLAIPNISTVVASLLLLFFVFYAFAYSLVAFFLSQRMDAACDIARQSHALENFSYKLRRFSEKLYKYLLTAFVLFVVIGIVPVIYDQFSEDFAAKTSAAAGMTGLISTLLGIVSSISTFLKTSSVKPGKIPIGLLVAISTLLLWFGLLMLAYHCMLWLSGQPVVIAALVAATLIFGFLANLNYISVHRYYRDRLMEVFMPDLQKILKPEKSPSSASTEADKARLCNMCWYPSIMQQEAPESDETIPMPYHIINTNVVLVSSRIAKFRGRGGDNFVLTPAYCGSNATGWSSTRAFMKGRMTLATAMAVSGAAVNPSTGVGGEGVTRQPFLSMLMGLLNIRLGYWVSNPNPVKRPRITSIPNFFLPGLSEMVLRKNLNEESRFLQLTDGGHFENLALYELIRRKVRVIIACDAAADPEYQFTDLFNALEKIRADFGVLVTINAMQLKDLIPLKESDKQLMAYARQGFIMADILYPDREPGKFIYIKSSFFRELSADLYGYKQNQPEFPNEPTSDQFFDEKQFEAYRELGYQTAWQMMNSDDVKEDVTMTKLFGN